MTQISSALNAQLFSAFVFTTWIVQSLNFLNPKFQASSHLLWLIARFVSNLVGNSEYRFARDAAQVTIYTYTRRHKTFDRQNANLHETKRTIVPINIQCLRNDNF